MDPAGNPAGHALLRSPASANLSKTAPDAEQPQHFRVCRDGVEIPPDQLPVQRAARGEVVTNEPVEDVFNDGSIVYTLVSAAPLLDPHGRVRGAVASVTDITQQRRAEAELRRRETFISGVFGSITDGFYALSGDWRFTFVNDGIVRRFGLRRDDIVGGHIWEMFPAAVDNEAYAGLHRAMAGRVAVEYEVYYEPWQRWFLDKAFPTDDGGLAVYSRDITARKQAEALQAGQRHVMEMVATGRPLADVLAATCRVIEEQEPGLLCSVLLPDENGRHTRMAVGASLPDSYQRELEGLRVGEPYIGSCGEALDCGKVVVVPDVLADERFAPEWRELLTAHGLRACRSYPVVAADGTVLASFAVYHREPGDPEPANKELVAAATHLAAIAIERRRAEEQLVASRRTLYALVERCPFGIYIVDADFRIASINTGSQEGAFANVRPAVGRAFDEAIRVLWPERVAAEVIKNFRHTLDTGEPYYSKNFVEPRADIDQTEGYEWELHRIDMPDRRPAVVCYYYDSTKLRQAERELREAEGRFRTMADNSPVLIWQTDGGGVSFVNRSYIDFFGVPVEAVVGMGWATFLHTDDATGYTTAYLSAFTQQKKYEYLCRFRRHDGEYRWLLNVGTPHYGPDGAFIGFIGCSVDVTDSKRAEEALVEADRKKDEFLATLAHELRNPLAPLRNGLQVMKLAWGNAGAVEKSRSMMERQVGQMAHLIDDLMDLSRISRGKIVLQKTRLKVADSVQDAVDISRPLIEERGHDLTLDVPPEPIYVDADRTRLSQILGNLLNNAAKYTDKGGRIRVAVERQGSDVVVAVEDNGVGIPAHMLPKVFEMFTQVDRSLEKSQGGLGIGLNIVKRLVDMHDGSIVAESDGHGTGSRFVVRLPVVLTVTTETPDEGSEPKAKPARRRILVVDDNEDGATSLAEMLNFMGNDTQTAFDGLEAVAVAEAFKPDVILMDIGMPKLNGFDACRRIRQQPWGGNVILVAQTGWGQDDDKKKSQEAGFNFHMVKPVDPAALEKMLAELKATTG